VINATPRKLHHNGDLRGFSLDERGIIADAGHVEGIEANRMHGLSWIRGGAQAHRQQTRSLSDGSE